jgi:hypothetical protein
MKELNTTFCKPVLGIRQHLVFSIRKQYSGEHATDLQNRRGKAAGLEASVEPLARASHRQNIADTVTLFV